MDYYTNEFKEFLSEHYVLDTWQFLCNTKKNIIIAEYCKNVIENSVAKIIGNHELFQQQLIDELNNKGNISVKKDDIPTNKINILDINVSLEFIIDKYIKDFFQYIRNSFDIMAQLINSAILCNKGLNIDKVDIASIFKELNLNYRNIFTNTYNVVKNIKEDEIFKYVTAFNNMIKHTYDIKSIISLEFFGDKKVFLINEFEKYRIKYEKVDIIEKINEIFTFTHESLDKIMNTLYEEIKLDRFNKNRIHKVQFYCRSVECNEKNFSIIYINKEHICDTNQDIYILLLSRDLDNIQGFNCDYDDILIRNKDGKYVGRCIAKEAIQKDGILKYRKYSIEISDDENVFKKQHIEKQYKFKPFLMEGIIETK